MDFVHILLFVLLILLAILLFQCMNAIRKQGGFGRPSGFELQNTVNEQQITGGRTNKQSIGGSITDSHIAAKKVYDEILPYIEENKLISEQPDKKVINHLFKISKIKSVDITPSVQNDSTIEYKTLYTLLRKIAEKYNINNWYVLIMVLELSAKTIQNKYPNDDCDNDDDNDDDNGKNDNNNNNDNIITGDDILDDTQKQRMQHLIKEQSNTKVFADYEINNIIKQLTPLFSLYQKYKSEYLKKDKEELHKLGAKAIEIDLVAIGPAVYFIISHINIQDKPVKEFFREKSVEDILSNIDLHNLKIRDPEAVRRFINRVKDYSNTNINLFSSLYADSLINTLDKQLEEERRKNQYDRERDEVERERIRIRAQEEEKKAKQEMKRLHKTRPSSFTSPPSAPPLRATTPSPVPPPLPGKKSTLLKELEKKSEELGKKIKQNIARDPTFYAGDEDDSSYDEL